MKETKPLGYTWYPQDWKTDESVLELYLEARAVYRELIDSAYLKNNEIPLKISLWARLWNTDKNHLKNIIEELEDRGLVVIDDDLLSVPSCETRLNIINRNRSNGKAGGRPKTQKKPKRNPDHNPNETQTVTQTKPKRNPDQKAKEKEREIEIEIESKEEKKINKRKVFTPPTLDEVAKYCADRNNSVSPQRFIDFYGMKGWMVGKNKMKDWKAAVRTWEGRDSQATSQSSLNTKGLPEIDSSKMTRDELMNL
mgnify:CR=1 FL=1